MRAAVFEAIGKPLAIGTVPDPTPGADDVIIRVSRAGICGSDLHLTEEAGALPAGMILGHEFAGTVVDAGMSGVAAGTRVTALPICACWHCADCEGGHFAHCTQARYVGIHRPGAFADYVAVDARMVQALPAGVSFDEGALVEPLAVGRHAVAMAQDVKGRTVLVLGGGPIGAAVVLYARLAGAADVVLSEPSPSRRALARDLGAGAVLSPREQDIGESVGRRWGRAPDIVFECVGLPGMIGEAIALVRSRGQVIVAGACFEPDSFMPMTAFLKEAVIRFSAAYTLDDFDAVIDSIVRHQVPTAALVTKHVALDDIPTEFEALRRHKDQSKILLTMAG